MVQRSGEVHEGIGGVNQRAIVVFGKPEARGGKVAAEDAQARIDEIEEFLKLKMKMQGLPQPLARLLLGICAHQQIQGVAIIPQQPRGEVAAEIAGRAGYEDRHKGSGGGAELVLAVAHAACVDQSSSRGARASSGRPSMSG